MYLIHKENGRIFGWTEELSKNPSIREATTTEVEAFFGRKEEAVLDAIEALDAVSESSADNLVVDDSESMEDVVDELNKVEHESDSTDSGSKKPVGRRGSRRRR